MIRVTADLRGGVELKELSGFELAQLATQVTREVNRRAAELPQREDIAVLGAVNAKCAQLYAEALEDFNADCGGLPRAESRGRVDVRV